MPDNVEVELQTLPDFNVIGRAKVDAKGRYRMEVKEDDRDWRVFCKCVADGPGGRFEYLATKHVEWEPYAKAYVQNLVLRRDYTSVAGRCVDKAGPFVKISICVIQYAALWVTFGKNWRNPIRQDNRRPTVSSGRVLRSWFLV